MSPIRYKATLKNGVCDAKGCSTYTTQKLCNACRCKKSRLSDPIRYAYQNLKNTAKQRGKDFSLTLEEFKTFCIKVNYVGFARGRSSKSFTIDRINNNEGYHIYNIQSLPKGENIKKYFEYDYRTKQIMFSEYPKDTDQDNPF